MLTSTSLLAFATFLDVVSTILATETIPLRTPLLPRVMSPTDRAVVGIMKALPCWATAATAMVKKHFIAALTLAWNENATRPLTCRAKLQDHRSAPSMVHLASYRG